MTNFIMRSYLLSTYLLLVPNDLLFNLYYLNLMKIMLMHACTSKKKRNDLVIHSLIRVLTFKINTGYL